MTLTYSRALTEFALSTIPHPITQAQHDAEVSRLIGYLATALEEPADGGVRVKVVRVGRGR